jgi:uncharacterized membrane protein
MRASGEQDLSRVIALVLQVGTWLASAVIAAGLLLAPGTPLVLAGIGLFISLPMIRVAVMLVAFFRRGDYRLGVISGLVLAIILLGLVLSMRPHAAAG